MSKKSMDNISITYAKTMEGYFVSSVETMTVLLQETIQTDESDDYDKDYITTMKDYLKELSAMIDGDYVAVIDENFKEYAEKLKGNKMGFIIIDPEQFYRIDGMLKFASDFQMAQVFGK